MAGQCSSLHACINNGASVVDQGQSCVHLRLLLRPHSSPLRLSPWSQPQSPVCLLKPKFQQPAPTYQQTCISVWGVPGGGQDCLCWSLSVLPVTIPLLHSPLSLWSSLCILTFISAVEGCSWEIYLFHSSLPGMRVPYQFLSPPLSSYLVTWQSVLKLWLYEIFCQHSIGILWELFHM